MEVEEIGTLGERGFFPKRLTNYSKLDKKKKHYSLKMHSMYYFPLLQEISIQKVMVLNVL